MGHIAACFVTTFFIIIYFKSEFSAYERWQIYSCKQSGIFKPLWGKSSTQIFMKQV